MSEEENQLSAEDSEKGLQNMVKQGAFAQVKNTFTESVFLVGFALFLGAPNTVIGILAAIPSITQLLQIPAVLLIDKFKNRRQLNFITQLGNRFGKLTSCHNFNITSADGTPTTACCFSKAMA